MGKCDLCGEEAGLLRKRHRECEARLESGKSQIVALVARSALSPVDPPFLLAQLAQIGQHSFLPQAAQKLLVIQGWAKAVDQALEDDVLSNEEERSLMTLADGLCLTRDDLDQSGAFTRVVKAAVIRDILQGTLPQRMSFVGELPFNFQKGESLVWVFTDATYYEQRVRRHYEGAYSGISVRVARGLYYRVGGFKGRPVQTTEMANMGTGMLGITDKHIYFAGPTKAFRVKYDKIVSFTPYSDGIGIQRDAQTAKPQVFVTGDGWFTYNLISNLAKASGTLTTR
jgi:hypothetical protein